MFLLAHAVSSSRTSTTRRTTPSDPSSDRRGDTHDLRRGPDLGTSKMATHRDHKNFGEPGDEGDTLKTVYKILGSKAEKTPKGRSPIGTPGHVVPDFLKP